MTEKEKMLAGLPYDPADHTLAADRCRAQTLCRRICLDPFGEAAARTALLKELFGSTGTDVYVEPNFRCDYGYNIHVGEGFYANYDCIMLDSAPITIGDGCMFGPRVSLITATHRWRQSAAAGGTTSPMRGNTRAPSPSATKSGWAPGSSSIPASPSETGR